MKLSKEDKIQFIRSEIINRVKAIESQKQEKKNVQDKYRKIISNLETEKNQLLKDLEDIHRQELVEEATEIIKANE